MANKLWCNFRNIPIRLRRRGRTTKDAANEDTGVVIQRPKGYDFDIQPTPAKHDLRCGIDEAAKRTLGLTDEKRIPSPSSPSGRIVTLETLPAELRS